MTDLSPRTLILGRVVELAVRFDVLHNQRIGRIAFKKLEQWCKLWKNKSRLLKFWIHRQHATRIRTEEQYLEKLKLQKKGLMHDLLTGKVRVKMEQLREAVL
jgi:type I restriction enzyme S subunit